MDSIRFLLHSHFNNSNSPKPKHLYYPLNTVWIIETALILCVCFSTKVVAQEDNRINTRQNRDSDTSGNNGFWDFADQQFNGKLQYDLYYSDQPFLGEAFSASTGWNHYLSASNQFSFFEIPVGLSYRYSNNPISRELDNGFTFEFDYEQYKSKILQKIKARAKEEIEQLKSQDTISPEVIEKYERYQKLFENNSLHQKLSDQDQLDSLKGEASADRINQLESELKQFEEQIKSGKELGKEKIKELTDKRAELDGKLQKLKQLKTHIAETQQIQKLYKEYKGLK